MQHASHVRTALPEEIPSLPGVEEMRVSGRRPPFGTPMFEVEPITCADGTVKNIEYVSVVIPGDPTSSPRHKVTDALRARYKPQYERWRAGLEMTMSGIPLEMCPFVKPAQIRALKAVNIFTAEDLEVVADVNLHRIPMGRNLQNQAKQFLENKRLMDAGSINTRETDLLREGFKQLEEQNAAMRAQLEALTEARAARTVPPAPLVEDDGKPNIVSPADLLAAEPRLKFMTFRAEAKRFLGDDMPEKKDAIIAALREFVEPSAT